MFLGPNISVHWPHMIHKICFVGLDNYPVLNPLFGANYIGGESVQQTLLSKAFSSLGYEVSMVDKDFGQRDGEVVDNITVWKTYADGKGIPLVRFIYPKVTSIFRALKNANADAQIIQALKLYPDIHFDPDRQFRPPIRHNWVNR